MEKVKIEKGNETETFVEILNIDALKDKQILTKGTYMLLNEGGGGHDH